MQPTADVLLYSLEAGSPLRALEERLAGRVRVDLADLRTMRFFRALPQAFFDQYAQAALLENVDEAGDFFDRFIAWRQVHPQANIVAAVYGSRPKMNVWWSLLEQNNLTLKVVPVPAGRVLFWHPESQRMELLSPLRDPSEAIGWAGLPQAPSDPKNFLTQTLWEEFFTKHLFTFLCRRLAVKKEDVFLEFLTALARTVSECANWTSLARECGISTPAIQKWVRGLVDCAVIDLVPGVGAAAARRVLMRPRVFWNQPGLAAWLVDPTLLLDEQMRSALQANLMYLAIKDALPAASFSHFLDTNKVCVPLMVRSQSDLQAFFCAGWQGWERREQALASVAPIVSLTQAWAWDPLPEKYDGLFDLLQKEP